MRAKLREIAEAAVFDPKQALFDSLGSVVDHIDVAHNRVVVATYVQPERTHGGVFLPDKALLEDRFQGKTGLVIKKGPLAFVDDGVVKFGGFNVEVGDWVIYQPANGVEIFLGDHSGGTPCRWVEDTNILGKTNDPSIVW